MIRFQPTTISNVQHYKFMEGLLTEPFPPEEYHEPEHLCEYAGRVGNFHSSIIFDGDLPIDFITYWGFDEFYYIKRLATNPVLRDGGYGKRTLEHLCEFLEHPIVLEVERPVEEMARRRINFYQRHELTLWEKDYYQPLYEERDDFLPMHLIVHGNLDAEKDYGGVRHKLHTIVYGAKE